MLAAIRDVCKLVVKELTSWVCCFRLYYTEEMFIVHIANNIYLFIGFG